jgi:hypothetical protein
MMVLLSKFRIDYSDLAIISYVNAAPKNKTKQWFDELIRPFRHPGGLIVLSYYASYALTNEKPFNFRTSHQGKRT